MAERETDDTAPWSGFDQPFSDHEEEMLAVVLGVEPDDIMTPEPGSWPVPDVEHNNSDADVEDCSVEDVPVSDLTDHVPDEDSSPVVPTPDMGDDSTDRSWGVLPVPDMGMVAPAAASRFDPGDPASFQNLTVGWVAERAAEIMVADADADGRMLIDRAKKTKNWRRRRAQVAAARTDAAQIRAATDAAVARLLGLVDADVFTLDMDDLQFLASVADRVAALDPGLQLAGTLPYESVDEEPLDLLALVEQAEEPVTRPEAVRTSEVDLRRRREAEEAAKVDGLFAQEHDIFEGSTEVIVGADLDISVSAQVDEVLAHAPLPEDVEEPTPAEVPVVEPVEVDASHLLEEDVAPTFDAPMLDGLSDVPADSLGMMFTDERVDESDDLFSTVTDTPIDEPVGQDKVEVDDAAVSGDPAGVLGKDTAGDIEDVGFTTSDEQSLSSGDMHDEADGVTGDLFDDLDSLTPDTGATTVDVEVPLDAEGTLDVDDSVDGEVVAHFDGDELGAAFADTIRMPAVTDDTVDEPVLGDGSDIDEPDLAEADTGPLTDTDFEVEADLDPFDTVDLTDLPDGEHDVPGPVTHLDNNDVTDDPFDRTDGTEADTSFDAETEDTTPADDQIDAVDTTDLDAVPDIRGDDDHQTGTDTSCAPADDAADIDDPPAVDSASAEQPLAPHMPEGVQDLVAALAITENTSPLDVFDMLFTARMRTDDAVSELAADILNKARVTSRRPTVEILSDEELLEKARAEIRERREREAAAAEAARLAAEEEAAQLREIQEQESTHLREIRERLIGSPEHDLGPLDDQDTVANIETDEPEGDVPADDELTNEHISGTDDHATVDGPVTVQYDTASETDIETALDAAVAGDITGLNDPVTDIDLDGFDLPDAGDLTGDLPADTISETDDSPSEQSEDLDLGEIDSSVLDDLTDIAATISDDLPADTDLDLPVDETAEAADLPADVTDLDLPADETAEATDLPADVTDLDLPDIGSDDLTDGLPVEVDDTFADTLTTIDADPTDDTTTDLNDLGLDDISSDLTSAAPEFTSPPAENPTHDLTHDLTDDLGDVAVDDASDHIDLDDFTVPAHLTDDPVTDTPIDEPVELDTLPDLTDPTVTGPEVNVDDVVTTDQSPVEPAATGYVPFASLAGPAQDPFLPTPEDIPALADPTEASAESAALVEDIIGNVDAEGIDTPATPATQATAQTKNPYHVQVHLGSQLAPPSESLLNPYAEQPPAQKAQAPAPIPGTSTKAPVPDLPNQDLSVDTSIRSEPVNVPAGDFDALHGWNLKPRWNKPRNKNEKEVLAALVRVRRRAEKLDIEIGSATTQIDLGDFCRPHWGGDEPVSTVNDYDLPEPIPHR